MLVPFEDLVKLSADKFIRPVYGQKSSSLGSVVETYVIIDVIIAAAALLLFTYSIFTITDMITKRYLTLLLSPVPWVKSQIPSSLLGIFETLSDLKFSELKISMLLIQ